MSIGEKVKKTPQAIAPDANPVSRKNGTSQQAIALIEKDGSNHSKYFRAIEQVLKISLYDDEPGSQCDITAAVQNAFEFCLETGWIKAEPALTPKMFADLVLKELK